MVRKASSWVLCLCLAGVDFADLDIITIDGYRVYCATAHQIESLMIQMKDGLNPGVVQLEARDWGVNGEIPISFGEEVTTHIENETIPDKHCQMVHKLQGRMLHNLVITAWCMGKVWPYVALSRVQTLNGVFGNRLNNSQPRIGT